MDYLYYVAVTILKWTDDSFWESSMRFLAKQLEIHIAIKGPKENSKNKSGSKVLSVKEVEEIERSLDAKYFP